MELSNRGLLVLQFGLSLCAWSAIAIVLIRPALARLDRRRALRWVLAPQLLRHLGASVLATGVAGPGLPRSFAESVAIGDLATAVLALVAFVALGRPGRLGVALAGVATAVGAADLLHNLQLGMRLHAADHLAGAWYVVAMLVPMMLVAHALAAERVLRPRASVTGTS